MPSKVMPKLFLKRDTHLTTALGSLTEPAGLFRDQELVRELYTMDIKGLTLKFQSLALPNGLVRNIFGLVGKTIKLRR